MLPEGGYTRWELLRGRPPLDYPTPHTFILFFSFLVPIPWIPCGLVACHFVVFLFDDFMESPTFTGREWRSMVSIYLWPAGRSRFAI